jgi:hypothetical protein
MIEQSIGGYTLQELNCANSNGWLVEGSSRNCIKRNKKV